jgi:hypothetical protein
LYGKCQTGPISHTNIIDFLVAKLGQKWTWSFSKENSGRMRAGQPGRCSGGWVREAAIVSAGRWSDAREAAKQL